MAKIFISHSAKDKPVIDTLSELLIEGCDLKNKDVSSDSIEDAGIMIGSDFTTWIKDHINESELIILLVTPNYIESKLCMAEMGAAWALDKEIFPFLHPDIDRELSFIFLGKHTTRLNENGLNNLHDFISGHIKKADKNTETWTSNRKHFLDTLPGLLKSLPAPEKYTAEEYNKIYKEKEAANNLYKGAREKNDEFLSLIENLKRSKKTEEVKKPETKPSTDHETDDKPKKNGSEVEKNGKAEEKNETVAKDTPDHKEEDELEKEVSDDVKDDKTDEVKDKETKDTPEPAANENQEKVVSKDDKDGKAEEKKETVAKDKPDHKEDDELEKEVSDDVKDDKADEVKNEKKKDPPDREAYDKLVKDVSDELNYFGKAVKRCLYAHFSNEDWIPSSNILKWHNADIEKALRRAYIENGSTKGSYAINDIQSTITPVIDKINELDKFLKEKISPELAEYLEKERFITFSIKNKEYWEKELLTEDLID
jgi:hypothetical protein